MTAQNGEWRKLIVRVSRMSDRLRKFIWSKNSFNDRLQSLGVPLPPEPIFLTLAGLTRKGEIDFVFNIPDGLDDLHPPAVIQEIAKECVAHACTHDADFVELLREHPEFKTRILYGQGGTPVTREEVAEAEAEAAEDAASEAAANTKT